MMLFYKKIMLFSLKCFPDQAVGLYTSETKNAKLSSSHFYQRAVFISNRFICSCVTKHIRKALMCQMFGLKLKKRHLKIKNGYREKTEGERFNWAWLIFCDPCQTACPHHFSARGCMRCTKTDGGPFRNGAHRYRHARICRLNQPSTRLCCIYL